jgi:serine/threonine protein kinase
MVGATLGRLGIFGREAGQLLKEVFGSGQQDGSATAQSDEQFNLSLARPLAGEGFWIDFQESRLACWKTDSQVKADHPLGPSIGDRDSAKSMMDCIAAGANGYCTSNTVHGDTRVVVKRTFMLEDGQLQDPLGLWKETRVLSAVAQLPDSSAKDHLPKYCGSGLTDAGEPYMLMEHIDGRSLESALSDDARMDYVRIGIGITSALEILNELNVIHQDIKPDNILVRPDGEAVVIDFGTASGQRGIAAYSPIFKKEQLVPDGNQAYHAPEYENPGLANSISPKSDVWSVGLVMLRAVTGSSDFLSALIDAKCRTPQEYQAALESTLEVTGVIAESRGAEVPEGFLAAISAMLEFHPDQRPSAAEAALLLKALALEDCQMAGA